MEGKLNIERGGLITKFHLSKFGEDLIREGGLIELLRTKENEIFAVTLRRSERKSGNSGRRTQSQSSGLPSMRRFHSLSFFPPQFIYISYFMYSLQFICAFEPSVQWYFFQIVFWSFSFAFLGNSREQNTATDLVLRLF